MKIAIRILSMLLLSLCAVGQVNAQVLINSMWDWRLHIQPVPTPVDPTPEPIWLELWGNATISFGETGFDPGTQDNPPAGTSGCRIQHTNGNRLDGSARIRSDVG